MNRSFFRIFSLIIALMFAFNSSLLCFYAIADVSTVTISGKSDLVKFAKKCTLDSWSVGKTVNLTCDIDLKDEEFTSIPIFNGTFNGNGYTISGVKITKNGSNTGFFRYIEKDAYVNNLSIEGTITPGGSGNFAGGIAGRNEGLIESCRFDGKLIGENNIGGIAGINGDNGRIVSCSVSGSITGENATGGITGENSGLILNCTNNSEINTVYEEKKKDVTDLNTDVGAFVETYKTDKEENNGDDSILGHTDTGGIAGYTYGIIQGCINYANIGYQHIGYNVGGIAGRQSGYILGCDNYGLIKGRKDVGGIAGQVEPYILLTNSESTITSIRDELNRLHSMIDKFISDTDNISDDTKLHLDAISEYADNARNSADGLVSLTTDFVDSNIDEINAQTAIISNTIDKLEPVFDSLGEGADGISSALDEFSAALDSFRFSAPYIEDEVDDINSALDDIVKAEKNIINAVSRVNSAMEALKKAVFINNQADVIKALSNLQTAVNDIIQARETISSSLEGIVNILQNPSGGISGITENIDGIINNLQLIITAVKSGTSAIRQIYESIEILRKNTTIDFDELRIFARHVEAAADFLSGAVYDMTNGFYKLGNALENLYVKIDDYTESTVRKLNRLKKDLSSAINSLSDASGDIRESLDEIKQIFNDLSKEDRLEFVKLGDDFRENSEELFNSLSDISGELNLLGDSLINSERILTGNLRSISNQFNLVMNLIVGEFENIQNGSLDTSDVFVDVSDEDVENTKQGKVFQCRNFGNIEADRNTGGIAGAMSVEYAKDPEDDIERPTSFNFIYRTKAVLDSCINEGKIIGKKDCTGGIVGYSELGTVFRCENYASVESTSGDYAGGIVGQSGSSVRKCYSKCDVNGGKYVGGIAGKADIVTSCYSIVRADGDECVGSVIGYTDGRDRIYGNHFVDSGTGAIDGISYKSNAEPITYDELKNIAGIPKRFISFTVTFVADGTTVEARDVKYGDKTENIKLPDIPEKGGKFGTWEEFEDDIVTRDIEITCEYKPYVTILSSEEKNNSGKLSVALAEGKFTDKAKLHVDKSDVGAPKGLHGNVAVYDLTLENTDIKSEDTVTVRFLNENKYKVTAWNLNDGKWIQTDVKTRGKYVILDTLGPDSTVCLKFEKVHFRPVYIIIALIIAAAVAVLVVLRKKKKA